MAPFACSILPSLLKVAADINHRSLNRRFSFACQLLSFIVCCGVGEGGGGGGGRGGGGGGDALDALSLS